jgi:hypothetical protein
MYARYISTFSLTIVLGLPNFSYIMMTELKAGK